MFSISKKLTHFKTFFSLFRYKSAYFTAINSNVTPENFSDKLSEIEDSNTIFNYDENRKKLIEISKIVFPNINQFSLKRQKVIFYTFTPYQMMDPIAYKTIEKNFMKSFSTMESNEIIKFLKCLSFGKNLTISPTIFLLIEQKIMKNLSSLTPEQFLSILESYDILDLKKNNKIYKILLSYFSNKYSSMSLLHTLKAIIFFIRSKQCDIRLLTEVLEGIYNKIFIKLDSLILPHMVLIYFLFFSDFLQKNLLAKKTFENNYKFQIKENINRILLTGQSSLDTSELNDITNSFIMNPKENYEKCHIKIEEKLDKIISCHLKINDIFILFDSFLYMERKLPKNIEEEIIKYIQENNFALTPNEIFKLIEIANDERLNSVTNIKNNLIISVYNYYEKFLNEFSSVELCNLWKCIDHFNLGLYYSLEINIFKLFFLQIKNISTKLDSI